jgi:hypothetical protein
MKKKEITMPDKSYVTMEQHICEVCGKPYDTGALLLDTRLRDRFDMHTVTAIGGMCEEHKKLCDEGFIALVGIKNSGSGNRLQPEHAKRTGTIMHLKKSSGAWGYLEEVFGIKNPVEPVAFISEDLLLNINDHLTQLQD